MKILAIDCSAVTASVAIMSDGKLLTSFFINAGLTHSQTLMPMVQSALTAVNITLKEIDYFAISAGPGSFTGLRIGIAAVKGMASALNKPCVSVSTLQAMAYNVTQNNAVVCAVMDARCSQVYNAMFRYENGKLQRLTNDRAISLQQLKDEIISTYANDSVVIVGDGTDITTSFLKESGLNNFPLHQTLKYQNAVGVAQSAQQQIIDNNILTPTQLMPIYLRLPQAERELKKKQQAQA